ITCIKEQRSNVERSLVELGVKVAWHAIAQQGFHNPRLVRHTCRHSWAIQPLIGMRLRTSNYLRPGAHRVRLFRRFDTRTAGRHPLTTGADGTLLTWIVSRASGGSSKHVCVVRISYTLSRDTTQDSKAPSFATFSGW